MSSDVANDSSPLGKSGGMWRFSESILASSTGTILGQDPTVNLGLRGWELGIISLRDHPQPMMNGYLALAKGNYCVGNVCVFRHDFDSLLSFIDVDLNSPVLTSLDQMVFTKKSKETDVDEVFAPRRDFDLDPPRRVEVCGRTILIRFKKTNTKLVNLIKTCISDRLITIRGHRF